MYAIVLTIWFTISGVPPLQMQHSEDRKKPTVFGTLEECRARLPAVIEEVGPKLKHLVDTDPDVERARLACEQVKGA